MTEYLDQRRRALENSFFAKVDDQLLAKLRAEMEEEQEAESLAQYSGIHDKELLERLVHRGFRGSTWAALSLVPLVEVAWADGRVVDREREAVLKAADESGIQVGSPAYQLLEQWLHNRPDPGLRDAWKEYVAVLYRESDAETRAQFRNQVLARAREVAEAWGGFLGMGSTISDQEQAVLDDLESVLA